MPRKRFFPCSDFAYHVTSRSNNREWFYISSELCWSVFLEKLTITAQKYQTEIHALVLMSNHFHLVISTPQSNLNRAMRYFLTETSRTIQNMSNRINHVFGARYRWSLLDSAYSLAYVMKYVYRNPLRAGICKGVETYPYSSFNEQYLKEGHPLVHGLGNYWAMVPRERQKQIQWLNSPADEEAEKLIQLGLRRKIFQFSTNSNHQRTLRRLVKSYGIGPNSPGAFQY